MSIFINDDLIEVEIRYAQLSKSDVVVINTKGEEELFKGKVKIKTLKAKFSRPGWQSFNEYMDETIGNSDGNLPVLNTVRLRRNKFRILLEYLEDDGNSIPLTQDLESKILPEIPIALIEEYDKILNLERINILKEKGILPEETEETEETEEIEETEDDNDKSIDDSEKKDVPEKENKTD